MTRSRFSLSDLLGKKGTVRQNTWEFYRGIINSTISPEIGLKTLAKLQVSDIRTLYTKLQAEELSASRIHGVHVTLNSALRIAVEDGIIQANPCAHSTVRIKAKKADKKKDLFVFTQEQVEQFLKSLSGWWKSFVLLAWATGMRREELLGLRWMDVDAKKLTVSVVQTVVVSEENGIHIGKPKNDASYRTIQIDKPCMAELTRFRAQQKESRRVVGFLQHNTDLVFGINGKMADPRQISKDFKKLAIAAGLPKESHLHTLRHTHATQLLRAGVNAKIVQHRLGHSTYQMTMDTYSHVTPDMQDGIADILTQLRAKK